MIVYCYNACVCMGIDTVHSIEPRDVDVDSTEEKAPSKAREKIIQDVTRPAHMPQRRGQAFARRCDPGGMKRPSSRLFMTKMHQSWQLDSPTTCAPLCSFTISVAASQYSCIIPFTPSRISPKYSRPSYAWLPRAPFNCTPRQILNVNWPMPQPFPSTCAIGKHRSGSNGTVA